MCYVCLPVGDGCHSLSYDLTLRMDQVNVKKEIGEVNVNEEVNDSSGSSSLPDISANQWHLAMPVRKSIHLEYD